MIHSPTEANPMKPFTAVVNLSGSPHLGRLLALPANIRLGMKGLPGTNALAFYKNS